jgi:hypothetical protein
MIFYNSNSFDIFLKYIQLCIPKNMSNYCNFKIFKKSIINILSPNKVLLKNDFLFNLVNKNVSQF